ncbi:Calmodulin-lysine N-methyltransferase [Rhynchospora pubera]|uniref:Calmodulin-lysine N-methyltransferase n=1 Tax=Rhynchospora pubera TaxID=906938 RepID=A0AAV8F2B4_9POAL|nr:Calmodulin-lysine N-methyltransferase [Rhynchospora pubera]
MEKSKSSASLRWKILRRSLRAPSPSVSGQPSRENVSRRTSTGFNLIKCRVLDGQLAENLQISSNGKDICVSYSLPIGDDKELNMIQRREDTIELNDFEVSTKYNIDTTGLVCRWPSEDVLAYYCINHADFFRSKRVLELGSGYGLTGFAIAACTDASEVIISDGNPQVVDYIQRNVDINGELFRGTKVESMILHWDQEIMSELANSVDVIVASDCTFFKEFHESLAQVVKRLLKQSPTSEAIFLGPKRGDSLHKFLERIREIGLKYELIERYDDVIWSLHQKFLGGNDASWTNYDPEHCYPLLLKISFCGPE